MAARIPQMPPLDPNRPEEAFRQITAWGNDVRLALESRQAAMEGLTLNPESPLWAGRNLPGIPALPVPVPTGFQAWGVYDAIQLVWDLQPDPAIDGYELLRDSAIIDFVRANCYTDIPIGDLSAHTYEVRTVRVGDGWRSAGVTATATATNNEATIRANHDAAFLGHQTAAMARNAATEIFTHAAIPSFSLWSESGVADVTGAQLTVVTPGDVPIMVTASARRAQMSNSDPTITYRGFSTVSVQRDAADIMSSIWGGWAIPPTASTISVPLHVQTTEVLPAGSYTYQLRLDVNAQPEVADVIEGILHYPALQAIVFKR